MATATRSPSPAAARPGCPMRRSADSNPFNPADCPQRSSKGGGGGCGCHAHASPRRRSLGEKENNDQRYATPKPARSGGPKNFMSPTISAASKAVAPSASPSRKKVLGERNDDPHLAPFSAANLAHKPKGTHDPRRLRLSFDGPAPAPPPPPAPEAASHGSRRSLAGDDARTENPLRVSVDHQHAAAADSVDAEPSRAALYDPKTNYTSPRPRFLHYKPNPRVEMYRHGGGGVRRLEEGFASESSEETDATTTEDDLTEEEQDQAHHIHLSEEALAAPSEAAAADEACVLPPESAPGSPGPPLLSSEPAVTSEPPRIFAAEPTATSPPTRALTPEPELGERSVRAPARKRSSLRFVFPLALVLFTAAFVCVRLPPDSPIMSNTALSKASDFLSVQELHPVELAAWLKQWSSSSLDSITSCWEAFTSTQEQEYFGPHFAANWSAAAADGDHGADFYYNFAEAWPVPIEEPISANVFTAEPEGDVVVEEDLEMSEEALGDSVFEEQLMIEDVVSEASNADLSAELEGVVVEELDVGASEEAPGSNGEDMASFSQNLEIPSEPTGQGEQDVESDESNDNHGNGKEGQEPYLALESDSSMWPSYLDRISKPAAAGVALVVVILSAGIAVLSMRKDQAQVATSVHVPAEQRQTRSGSASSEDHRLGKSPQFQSSVAEETQRFGDSGFSQYSSSLSSGHGGRKAKEEENISLEPTSKRESMSYSTSSYGSFTTYEKIAAKNRGKEDEAMTPVRRSSRLRSVKSPEA